MLIRSGILTVGGLSLLGGGGLVVVSQGRGVVCKQKLLQQVLRYHQSHAEFEQEELAHAVDVTGMFIQPLVYKERKRIDDNFDI